MRIFIITQNDPFYLSDNLEYLINEIKKDHIITGAVVSKASPFGKSESFFAKTFKTLQVFGLSFFIYYSIKYIKSKLFIPSIHSVFTKNKISIINITGSINKEENLFLIKNLKPDLIISILGNQIFKKPLIDLAPKGCINLHTSLLPKYRGLMPTFWVLKNNEKFTGVSVFFVDEGIDSGPIIIQKKIVIGDKTQQELIKETKKIGMNLILKSIKLINNNQVKLISNPNSKKTYYSFPTKEDIKKFKMLGKKFF